MQKLKQQIGPIFRESMRENLKVLINKSAIREVRVVQVRTRRLKRQIINDSFTLQAGSLKGLRLESFNLRAVTY